ncbi:MAG: NAD(P)/FAD-dependent oxidoreductase [Clostridiales bacterium]|nr:NAD(P)/FAD-dependent oxidoreductase [Clostridiales bacterium]
MKKVIIIGSGMGGLAAGIHARLNGFETEIFEAHSKAGGQCTSWKRKGYVFDGCLHHFGGFAPELAFYDFWKTLGVIPCEQVNIKECVSAVSPEGVYFHDYYNLEKLSSHMKSLSPNDSIVIDEYIRRIELFQKGDPFGSILLGTTWDKVSYLPYFIKRLKYFKDTLKSFGERFEHPLLKKAFPLLNYSLPNIPLFFYLSKHISEDKGGMDWPKGGSITISNNIVNKYQQLGGVIHYNKKVKTITTKNSQAVGVILEDGSAHQADYVISNADGRKTIMDMLSGKYTNDKTLQYCKPQDDELRSFAVMVFIGVKRDLSSYPSSLIMFLKEKVEVVGEQIEHLDLQIYGYDQSMAPEGKGVIKVELFSKRSYFDKLSSNKKQYEQEKDKVAKQVIALLEQQFPNLNEDVEVVDVATLSTWEHFMHGTDGFDNFPNKKSSILGAMFGDVSMYTLPKLTNFYFAGGWVTSAGALILNAKSGRTVIQKICKDCGVKFKR